MGVPAGGCGDAATSDGKGGCAPTLPATACGKGLVAYPGEAACHPVMECPKDKWGGAPATALHVDQGAAVGTADGSLDKPFHTIQAALDASTTGSLIVVAAGSYPEDLVVTRRVELRGVCPEQVEIVGQGGGSEDAALRLRAPATVSGFAIRGPSHAVYAQGYSVELHHLWIHDAGSVGVGIEQTRATDPSSVHDVLVEHADIGLTLTAGAPTLERIEVRDAKSSGAFLRFGPGYVVGGTATFRHALFDRNKAPSVLAESMALVMEDSTVRATVADKGTGIGVGAYDHKALPGASSIALTRTIVSGSMGMAITHFPKVAGALVELDACTITDVQRTSDGFAAAVHVPALAEAHLTRTTVRDSDFSGVMTYGGKLVLDHCLVSDVRVSEQFGVGVFAMEDGEAGAAPTVDLSSTRIQRVAMAGLWLSGGVGRVSGSAIDTVSGSPEGLGDGLLVVSADRAGVMFQGDLTVDRTLVQHAARASMSAYGANVSVRDSAFRCSGFDFEIAPVYSGDTPGTGEVNLVDGGGTWCGCGTPRECRAQSSTTAPIDPAPPKRPSF